MITMSGFTVLPSSCACPPFLVHLGNVWLHHVETTLIWTVHTKSQAKKGTRGNTGSCQPMVDSRAWKHSLTSHGPNRAKRGARACKGSKRARVSPTKTAPGRAGRTCCRAPPGRTPAVGARRSRCRGWPSAPRLGGTRRDRCSGPQRAGGGGEQWTSCQSECESPTLTPGRAGQGKEGTQETRPQDLEAGGRAKVVRWARRRLLFRGHQKNQGPTEQHSGGKMVFRIGLESEGAANDSHTYPIKNSHQSLLD